MEHTVKILSIHDVTHNVRSYRFEKPSGYTFEPGQATEVSFNDEKWKEEKRPFTFTGLNSWPYLEFTIKSYGDHDGVTNRLGKARPGDELIIGDVWGAIQYKGPGYFIAGGAGITPFIAILRDLKSQNKLAGNKLFFSNKSARDIILRKELDEMMGINIHHVITNEQDPQLGKGFIDKAFLQGHVQNFKQNFYICGPDKMVAALTNTLTELGAKPDAVVFEK
jgi:ferredoxin-NADP reductase